MEPTIVSIMNSNKIQSTDPENHIVPQPIKDVTPNDPAPQTSAAMSHNPENFVNLGSLTKNSIVSKTIPSTLTDEVLTRANDLQNNPQAPDPPTFEPGVASSSPPTSTQCSAPIIESNSNQNHVSNKNDDNDISDTLLNNVTNEPPLDNEPETSPITIPTESTHPVKIQQENDIKSIQENTELTQNLQQTEASFEQKIKMDVDDENDNIPLNNAPDACENNISPKDKANECENINENLSNDSGIGTETKIQKQPDVNGKEEMDIDEEQAVAPHSNTVTVECADASTTYNNDEKIIQNVQTSSHNKPENNANIAMDAGYDEELDEDFNADEEEEEDDESNEGSEDIAGDDDESDNMLLSELADIDIVCDDTIYTEEAPRWITSRDDGSDFNVEDAYQSWERDKQQFGTIYSDREGADDGNDNEDIENGGDFFASLLNKYAKKSREDPEKDKIKTKGGDYKLDDAFIDDGNCFEQNGVETVFGGFFIAKGIIDIKTSQNKPNKKKLPNIPETYKKDLQLIQSAVRNHQHVIDSIRDPKQRYSAGVLSNPEMYLKFTGMDDSKQEEKHMQMDEDTMNVYRSLLLMLVEFDTTLLRDKISGQVKYAICNELTSIFAYDPNESNRKQQQNFEELLNWFSYDWYDDTEDVRKGKKMNWRVLFLEVMEKRAKARFHNRMNKVRKETADNAEKANENKYQATDIPWDQIVSDIFLMTCYSMESMALIDGDMDKAAHECHMQLRESISKYLEGGTKDITMADIEKRYNEQTRKVFPNESYCYSYLVVQRIKEIKRNEKRHRKTPKKTPKKATPKKVKSPLLKKPVVDLTHTPLRNNDNNDNRNRHKPLPLAPSPPVFQTASVEYQINTEPLAPATNPVTNDVIDLTGNETNANTDNIATATSATLTTSNASNTPKTEQKSLNMNINTRKRRRSEMEPGLTQNPFGEITQMDPELTQNPFASKSISPPNKRRKLTEKAEFCNASQSVIQSQVERNIVPTPKVNMVLPTNSLIAVLETGTLHNEGATICFLMTATDEGVHYRYYDTGTFSNRCIPTHFCYYIKYMKNYSLSDLSKPVLALKRNKNDEYEAKYVMADVTHAPQHNNDYIGVKYMHNGKEVKMPTYTSLKTAVTYPHYGNFMLPTVIPVISLHQILNGNISPRQIKKSANVVNKNVNNNTNVKAKKEDKRIQIAKRSKESTNVNDENKNNNIRNGNTNTKITVDAGPPSSNIFYRDLPADPWNDQHFQGKHN